MPKVSAAYVAAKRQEILATASSLFAEHGFAQVSMADICTQAGMSAGAIYRYFPSRDDLVLAVCRARGGDPDRPDETAEAMIDRLLDELDLKHARLVCQIYAESAVRPDLAAVIDERRGEIRTALARRIAGKEQQAAATAELVLAGIDGFAGLVARRAAPDRDAFRRSLHSLVREARSAEKHHEHLSQR